jgi:hypothetical protein
MENLRLILCRWVAGTRHRLEGIKHEASRIKVLIFESTVSAMIKNMFEAIEATFRAVIYLLILLMGLSMAGLGAFTLLFLSIRIGQFLWTLILSRKWI